MTEQNSRREKQLRNQRHWQAHVKALQQSGLSRAEVWIPKCRRKVLYGELRKHLGEYFHE